MLHTFQITVNALHALFQSWWLVQYSISLYNLAWVNVSPLNPLNFSEGYASTKPI